MLCCKGGLRGVVLQGDGPAWGVAGGVLCCKGVARHRVWPGIGVGPVLGVYRGEPVMG